MSAIAESISVLIADDYPVICAGIRAILDKAPDIQVVGEAQDGIEVQELVAKLHPRILLLDLQMSGPRPLEIERWVHTHCPETIILVLTAHDCDAYLAEMIATSIAGFIIKSASAERLVDAIRRAARGEILFNGEQLARACRWQERVERKWESLTKREQEVLRLLAQGLDNETIAQVLYIATRTVEFHITNILSKLEVSSRLEAVTWVHDHLPNNLWKSTG